MSTNTQTIYQKLLEIQKHINGLGKDKKSYGFNYVTGSKVLSHIKPKMNELGLILKQEVLSIENDRQDYATKNGSKSEILCKVMMKFTWIDCETGDKDENLFGSNGQNDWDKGVGSALTYAERYFLLKYFHIATDEDDIDNPEREENKAEPVKAEAQDSKEVDTKPRMRMNENHVAWAKTVKKISEGVPMEVVEEHFILTDVQKQKLVEQAEELIKNAA